MSDTKFEKVMSFCSYALLSAYGLWAIYFIVNL